jgi:RNA polymerase sigma-70 factor (ECF subfamily)
MTALADASTNHLLSRMQAGDEAAFAELYRRLQGKIYCFALQMSGSASVAEEVTQEVFLALIRDPRRYDARRGPVSAYLYGIARNCVLRSLPTRRSDTRIEEEGCTEFLMVQENPLGDLTRKETIEEVRRAVLSLPGHYREVVVLCDLHEMDYAEASNVLSCSVGTVRSRLHRARKLLLDKLKSRSACSPAGVTLQHLARCTR